MGRIVEFSLDISDSPIACMRGDGVVVASATGSTAYALSAGGPLVAPSFNGLIVVPLAPPYAPLARGADGGERRGVRDAVRRGRGSRGVAVRRQGHRVLRGARASNLREEGEAPTVLLRSQDRGFYTYASGCSSKARTCRGHGAGRREDAAPPRRVIGAPFFVDEVARCWFCAHVRRFCVSGTRSALGALARNYTVSRSTARRVSRCAMNGRWKRCRDAHSTNVMSRAFSSSRRSWRLRSCSS